MRIQPMIAAGLMGIIVAGTVGLALAEGTTTTTTQPTNKFERHPEIRRALLGLREAKNALEKADHDFAGHRKEALSDTEKAIHECEQALKVD